MSCLLSKGELSETTHPLIFYMHKRGDYTPRAVDFVGTICKIDGITAQDIGIITITEAFTYVEIVNNKGKIVLQAMKNTLIKGKKLKVHEARN